MGLGIDRLQMLRDTMVHMAQKYQPHAAVRSIRSGFLPVTGLADTAPIRAIGLPGGNKLGENKPQAPHRKNGDQSHGHPGVPQQGEDGDDNADQDRDAAPKRARSFH